MLTSCTRRRPMQVTSSRSSRSPAASGRACSRPSVLNLRLVTACLFFLISGENYQCYNSPFKFSGIFVFTACYVYAFAIFAFNVYNFLYQYLQYIILGSFIKKQWMHFFSIFFYLLNTFRRILILKKNTKVLLLRFLN